MMVQADMTGQELADSLLRADWERRAALQSGNASRLARALVELDSLFALADDKRTA